MRDQFGRDVIALRTDLWQRHVTVTPDSNRISVQYQVLRPSTPTFYYLPWQIMHNF